MLKTIMFFEEISIDKLRYHDAKGQWTPKEILLHLIDTERVFSYSAHFSVRAEIVMIKGFDKDGFV